MPPAGDASPALAFGTTSAPACVRITGAVRGNRFVALATPPVDFAALASNRLRDIVAVTAGLVRVMAASRRLGVSATRLVITL